MRVPFAVAISSLISATQAPSVPASPPALMFGDECAVPADFAPPFVRTYRFPNGGRLVFVAVRHEDAPTQAVLKEAFARYRPDEALVEGIGSSRRDDAARRQRLLAYADDRLASGKPDEVATTIRLAADAHISVAGWDLTPEEDYAAASAAGFALPDIVGAHLARRKIDPAGDRIAPALAAERKGAPAGAVDGFDYPAWYRRNYGDRFITSSGTPCGTGVAARIVKAETAARNRNAAAVLERTISAGRTVLIEAGANHWLALDPWLRSIATADGRGEAQADVPASGIRDGPAGDGNWHWTMVEPAPDLVAGWHMVSGVATVVMQGGRFHADLAVGPDQQGADLRLAGDIAGGKVRATEVLLDTDADPVAIHGLIRHVQLGDAVEERISLHGGQAGEASFLGLVRVRRGVDTSKAAAEAQGEGFRSDSGGSSTRRAPD